MQTLYDRGLYLQAWRLAQPLGPVRAWEGSARVFGGRLVRHLGAPRLSDALILTAWRRAPADAEAFSHYAHRIFSRRGPWPAWELLRGKADWPDAAPRVRSDLAALRGNVAAALRDFDLAWTHLREAESLDADRPWLSVVRSFILDCEDRPEDALAEARRALEERPWYRPGVSAVAGYLLQLGRDAEALDLLREASARLECAPLWMELARLEIELGLHEPARASLERTLEFTPLLENPLRDGLNLMRADVAYLCGDLARAAELARGAKEPHYREFGERLRAGTRDRVKHDVPYVRQNRSTCVPATVASLTQFWGRPAAHLEIADEICYDGTPHHSQRVWAEKNGWHVREFTVTWDSATDLLRRGVPFALSTVHPTGGHLQAVMGFDAARRTLLARDPNSRGCREYDADGLIEAQRSTGPRGMALVPEDRRSILEGLSLPDAPLYDRLHELHRALAVHDRAAAERAMHSMDPRHRLARHARRTLGGYDNDRAAIAEANDALLRDAPDDPLLLLTRLSLTRELQGRRDVLGFLQDVCGRDDAHPIFWREYGKELPSVWWLRRYLACMSDDAEALAALAEIRWDERRLEEALELARFAACLEDKRESFAHAYFRYARLLGRGDEAVAHLTRRFEAWGAKSGWPAITLARAHFENDAASLGLEVIEKAVALRPDDPELLLFAAESFADRGDAARAREFLARADGKARKGMWLFTAARIDPSAERWGELVALEPLNLDAQQAYVQSLPAAEAAAHLGEMIRRFPRHYGLRRLRVEWLRDVDVAAAEEAVNELFQTHPNDLWALRERAWLRILLGRREEAVADAEAAIRIAPHDPIAIALRGRAKGDKADYRRALELSIDHEPALRWWMEIETTRELAEFVRAELKRQATTGEGLLAFGDLANRVYDDSREPLQEMVDRWPARWASWVAAIRGRVDRDDLAEAKRLAEEAVKRFPLEPRVWQAAAPALDEIRCLREAVRLSPGDVAAQMDLAAALERKGEIAECRAILEKAAARNPNHAGVQGGLAWQEWKAGDRESAYARIERVVRLAPEFVWAWDAYRDWAREMKCPDAPLLLARRLTIEAPHDEDAWLALSRIATDVDERLKALEHCRDADDPRAVILGNAGRFDEARAVAKGIRAAWVEAMDGEFDRAIRLAKEVVKDDGRNALAWFWLSQWHRLTGDVGGQWRSAAKAVEVEPRNARLRYELALAELARGERPAAKLSLQRALELDPMYGDAAAWLFDLCLEDREDVSREMELLKRHHSGAPVVSREIRLALSKSDYAAAAERLAALARMPSEGALAECVEAFVKSGQSMRADDILAEALDFPEAAGVWVSRRGSWGEWGLVRRKLAELRASGRAESWVKGAAAYLESLAGVDGAWRIRWFLRKHGEELRADMSAWGTVGYALYAVKEWRRAVRWLDDWESRKGLRPWMLSNLALSLRELGRDAEAERVSKAALKLDDDGSSMLQRLWVALDEACGGGEAAAKSRLKGIDPSSVTDHERMLLHCAWAVLAARRRDDAEAERRLLLACVILPSLRERCFRRTFRRAVHAAGRARGGWLGFWWRIKSW